MDTGLLQEVVRVQLWPIKLGLGYVAQEVVRSRHVGEYDIHSGTVACELGQGDVGIFQKHEIIDSFFLLHFGFKLQEEGQALEETVIRRHEKV